jgi:hypothetical protein
MDSYEPAMPGDTFPRHTWETASFCGPNGGNCVEVNLGRPGHVGLRDSKRGAGPVLAFAGREWGTFLATARTGRLDRP